MNNTIIKFLFLFLMAYFFIIGFQAAINYKQLFNDGAFWALSIVNNSDWHIESLYYRYFTLLLQTPAVISTKFTTNLHLSVVLFCLGYFVYPFIIVMSLVLKYRNNPRFDFIYVCLLTFFITIVPNWAFGVSIVNESVILSWPLLFYIIATDKPKSIFIAIFSILLALTYETAIVYLWLAFYILLREKKSTKSHFLIFLSVTLFQIWNLVQNIFPQNAHIHFKSSLPEVVNSPMFWIAIAAMPVLLILIPQKNKKVQYSIVTLLGLFSGFILFKTLTHPYWAQWVYSYHNRIWAIPISCLVLFAGYELLKSTKYKFENIHLTAILILCIPSIRYEYSLNEQQAYFHDKIKNLVAENPGCHTIPIHEWKKFKSHSYIADWSFPHMSILYNESLDVTSLISPEILDAQNLIIVNQHLCNPNKGNIEITNQFTTYLIPVDKRLNFSQIFKDQPQ